MLLMALAVHCRMSVATRQATYVWWSRFTPMVKLKILLSSGTEDYFLGTYYFNRGGYENAVAGMTHKTTANCSAGPAAHCCWNRANEACSSSAQCDPGGEGCIGTGTATESYGKVVCSGADAAAADAAHQDAAAQCTHFSAYRLHADDPLIFHDGMSVTWRNGDPSGCIMKYGSAGGASLEGKIHRVDPDCGSTLTVFNSDSQSNCWVN